MGKRELQKQGEGTLASPFQIEVAPEGREHG